MNSEVQFPANSVLDWYKGAERMLVDFLRYVPYCDAHEQVWSPKLVTILQETCSQLDSLWRWEATNIHKRNDKEVDITDYFELYGAQVSSRWLVFWADEPKTIKPFSSWQNTSTFSKGEYTNHLLDWWKEGYQKIKHSRVENRCCATLKRTVESLAGLFLAIIRCERCWNALWEKHWMSWDDSGGTPFDPLNCLKEDYGLLENENRCGVMHMAIDSKLFTYPVGLCTGLVTRHKRWPRWKGNCSNRFKAWYYNYCQSTTMDVTSAN